MIRPISFLYVNIVKRIALGLSVEDGEELARGLYCIRPHERFRTHLLGSAWLCYCFLLARFWAPMYLEIALEQTADPVRVYDYERALQAGVRALNVWKVCQRNAGIVHAFARRAVPTATYADEVASRINWQAIAAGVAFVLLAYGLLHQAHGAIALATFTPFYIDQASGASNLNAGSTSANAGGSSAAALTYAGGTFVRATGVFTPASGNPASDGVTVGQYASVYTTAGAVAATFVAQVTARDATTITVDITTLKWGVATSVSEGAAASTLKVSGAWASEIVLAATGLGTFTAPVSTKINFTGNLTGAASRTVTMAGSTTALIWFSGYNTTPGDLDADRTNTLAKPVWTFNSTFTLTATVAHQLWSSVSVVGSRTGTLFNVGSSSIQNLVRVRVENTSSNAGAIAITNGNIANFAYCWFKCPATATTTGVAALTSSVGNFIGCVADTGGLAGFNIGSSSLQFVQCIGLNNTGAAFLSSTGSPKIFNCTAYGATVDGFKFTTSISSVSPACVVGCLFSGLNSSTATTNGINNATGTNTNLVFRSNNDYYNVTNPEVGFGDSPAFFPQTDSSPVVTSATNMTPVAGSNALANGFPGIFENETFSSYPNIGAVQQIAATGIAAKGVIVQNIGTY